jgi:hypothetical protein
MTNDEDDDWDKEDDLDKTYRRDMIEHRLHENATAAMREMIVKAGLHSGGPHSRQGYVAAADQGDRPGFVPDGPRDAEGIRADARRIHRGPGEQRNRGRRGASGGRRVRRDYEGATRSSANGSKRRSRNYPTLDVYHEVRKAMRQTE